MTRVDTRLTAPIGQGHRLTIGGVDYSLQFNEFTGEDSFVQESGLVTFSGQISLDAIRNGQPINNWDNPELFAIGTLVVFEVYQGGALQTHPRGNLRITGSRPDEGSPEDGRPPTQTLDVACAIGARLNSGPTDESELLNLVNVGGTTTATTVINRLFSLANVNIPTYNQSGTTLQFRDVPRLSGSYLQSAGRMLASIGLFAFSDRNGNTQAWRATASDPIMTISEAELADDMSSVIVGNPPKDNAIVSGNYRVVYRRADLVADIETTDRGDRSQIVPLPLVQRTPTTQNVLFSGGGYGDISEFKQSEDISFGNSTVTTTEEERQLGFLVYRGIYGYTVFGLADSQKVVSVQQYEDGDEAKLLSTTTTTTRPLVVVLANYVDWLLSNNESGFFSLNLDQLIETVETTTYKYDDQQQLIETVYTRTETFGEVLGALGGLDWSIVDGIFSTTKLISPQTAESTVTSYEAKSPDDWDIITRRRIPTSRDSRFQQGILSDILTAQSIGSTGVNSVIEGILNRAVALGSTSTTTQKSNTGQTKPPATERMPAEIASETRSAERIVQFGGTPSGWVPQIKRYTIPYLSDRAGSSRYGRSRVFGTSTQETQCYNYGRTWHGVAKASHQSAEMGFPLRPEFFSSYRPWAVVRVMRLDGSVYDFALNGTAWGVDSQEAIVRTNGALIERIQGATITAGGQPVTPGTIPTEPIVITGGTVEIPPAQQAAGVSRIRLGIKISSSFTAPTSSLSSQIKIGLKLISSFDLPGATAQVCWDTLTGAEWDALTEAQWDGLSSNDCTGGSTLQWDTLTAPQWDGMTASEWDNI